MKSIYGTWEFLFAAQIMLTIFFSASRDDEQLIRDGEQLIRSMIFGACSIFYNKNSFLQDTRVNKT